MNSPKCAECGKQQARPLTSIAVPKGKGVGLAVCDKCVNLPDYAPYVKK